MKRLVPMWIAIIAGFVMLLSTFFPITESLGETVGEIFNVVAAIAFVLGAGSLAKVNLAKISRRDQGWGYAAITLICFAITLVVGLGKLAFRSPPSSHCLDGLVKKMRKVPSLVGSMNSHSCLSRARCLHSWRFMLQVLRFEPFAQRILKRSCCFQLRSLFCSVAHSQALC